MRIVRGPLLTIAKWLWLLVVVAVVTGLVKEYWREISQQISVLTWWQLTASAGSVLVGKLLLSISAQQATHSQGWRPSLLPLLAVISLSQLGKYIPGGIWHFLGRAALYAARGLRPIGITRALILENVWQWGAALFVGALFLLYSCYGDLNLPLERHWGVMVAIVTFSVLWRALFWWSQRRFTSTDGMIESGAWSILGLQAAAWTCFGISMWFLFPVPLTSDGLVLAVGAFALATLAGFLVPLAPAGLGVREVALVVLLARQLSAEQAAICASMSRLVWLVVEAGLASILYGRVYPAPASEPVDPSA